MCEQQKWSDCRKTKDTKTCGGEPVVNNRLSEAYRKNAVDLYGERLLAPSSR